MYGANSYNIKLEVNVDDVPLDIDTAIPCGLIINELVSNSLKYGFPAEMEKTKSGRQESGKPEGEIRVGLCAGNDGKLILTVSDNGIGFPEDLDFQNTDSLGLQLVNTLTGQLEGDIQLDRKAGTTFNITFAGPRSKRKG
jgi:two-component sensor histidine kinase